MTKGPGEVFPEVFPEVSLEIKTMNNAKSRIIVISRRYLASRKESPEQPPQKIHSMTGLLSPMRR